MHTKVYNPPVPRAAPIPTSRSLPLPSPDSTVEVAATEVLEYAVHYTFGKINYMPLHYTLRYPTLCYTMQAPALWRQFSTPSTGEASSSTELGRGRPTLHRPQYRATR